MDEERFHIPHKPAHSVLQVVHGTGCPMGMHTGADIGAHNHPVHTLGQLTKPFKILGVGLYFIME